MELDFPADLYGAVRQEAEACRMKKWGNITVYIGKVRREACIRCIAEKLPFQNEEDKRPERSFDEIACVSLQLTPEGKYVRHSLSLSTIVWAMKQIRSCSGRLSECLEEGAYRAEVSELEGRFFPKEEGAEPVKAAPIHRCLVFLSSCLRTEVPETGKMTTITWDSVTITFPMTLSFC